METCEVHSMSMEFFAWKYMNKFFGDRADDYRYMHLSNAVSFIPYGTMVDYFQQLVYENYDMTPKMRNDLWLELETVSYTHLDFTSPTKNFSEELAALIDNEIKNLIDNAYTKAKSLLTEHMDKLHLVAKLLIEKEKISAEEFKDVMSGKITEVNMASEINENTVEDIVDYNEEAQSENSENTDADN